MGDAEVEGTAGEVDVCGGPLAQADFCGSWVEIFGVDVVEGLLILKRRKGEKRGVRHRRRGGRNARTSCWVKLFGSAMRCKIGIIYSLL